MGILWMWEFLWLGPVALNCPSVTRSYHQFTFRYRFNCEHDFTSSHTPCAQVVDQTPRISFDGMRRTVEVSECHKVNQTWDAITALNSTLYKFFHRNKYWKLAECAKVSLLHPKCCATLNFLSQSAVAHSWNFRWVICECVRFSHVRRYHAPRIKCEVWEAKFVQNRILNNSEMIALKFVLFCCCAFSMFHVYGLCRCACHTDSHTWFTSRST